MPQKRAGKFFNVYEAYGFHPSAPSETIIRILQHEYRMLAGDKTPGAKFMRRILSKHIAAFENPVNRKIYDARLEFHKHVKAERAKEDLSAVDFNSLFPHSGKREPTVRRAEFGDMFLWFNPMFHVAAYWQAVANEMRHIHKINWASGYKRTALDDSPFTPGRPLSRSAWRESIGVGGRRTAKVNVSP